MISSGSVVVKDVESMSVVGGNLAKELKKRKCVHKNLVVESLLVVTIIHTSKQEDQRLKRKSIISCQVIIIKIGL